MADWSHKLNRLFEQHSGWTRVIGILWALGMSIWTLNLQCSQDTLQHAQLQVSARPDLSPGDLVKTGIECRRPRALPLDFDPKRDLSFTWLAKIPYRNVGTATARIRMAVSVLCDSTRAFMRETLYNGANPPVRILWDSTMLGVYSDWEVRPDDSITVYARIAPFGPDATSRKYLHSIVVYENDFHFSFDSYTIFEIDYGVISAVVDLEITSRDSAMMMLSYVDSTFENGLRVVSQNRLTKPLTKEDQEGLDEFIEKHS